jgi:hypothetical protein
MKKTGKTVKKTESKVENPVAREQVTAASQEYSHYVQNGKACGDIHATHHVSNALQTLTIPTARSM